MIATEDLNIVLMGLDFNSRNLGCSALGYSFLQVLEDVANTKNIKLNLVSVNYANAEYHGKLVNMIDLPIHIKQKQFRQRFSKAVSDADLVFDFTGGDSFTDIYGLSRFIRESAFKQFVISKGKNLIFGPQTIGPFNKKISKLWAKSLVRKSKVVFTRDQISQEYCESEFGILPRLTTDIAFMLQPDYSGIPILTAEKKVGINVSGLLWHGGYTGQNELGLTINYQQLIKKYIEFLIDKGWDIWLIPHVLPEDEGAPENDYTPMAALKEEYPQINLATKFKTPMEAKAFISKMDLFVGSRMHATIGAFSMKVPTISIAYSRKFQGLYNGVDYPYVIDAKKANNEQALNLLIEWTQKKDQLGKNVLNSLVSVEKKNQSFVDDILKLIESAIDSRRVH